MLQEKLSDPAHQSMFAAAFDPKTFATAPGIEAFRDDLMILAQKMVEMYEIRSKIPGVVTNIYKHEGEAVTGMAQRSLEPVCQIQNYDVLRVEGFVGRQRGKPPRGES